MLPYTICTFCYLTSCISPGLPPCPAMMRRLWWGCGYITFLQLTDPLHQGIQRALGLQPVSGRGVGQHALLLLEVVHFLQKLFLQLSKTTLQQVTELAGEGGAWYVGPHLLLLMKGGQRDYEAFSEFSHFRLHHPLLRCHCSVWQISRVGKKFWRFALLVHI